MPRSELAGTRIRERRLAIRLRQAELARDCGISASYLNLIEHNRRRIGGKLLMDIARRLDVDPASLSEGAGAARLQALREAASALKGGQAELDRAEEFVGGFPGWAALVAAQADRLAQLERTVETLSDRLTHDPYLSASLHDVLSKVTSIRSTSAILTEDPDLAVDWRSRFHRNLYEDSQQLAETSQALVSYLDAGADTSRDMKTPRDELDGWLFGRGFHLPELEGREVGSGEAAAVLAGETAPTSRIGRTMAQAHLERYSKEAALLPMAPLVAHVAQFGLDPELVAQVFEVSLPVAMRRLASLPLEKAQQPVGLVICDVAGALTLRKEIDGFEVPRFGAGCALWPLYRALMQPLQPLREEVQMPGAPGQRFVCHAVAEPLAPPRIGAPMVLEAVMMIQPATASNPQAVPSLIGSTCRVCPRAVCLARREPSILSETAVG